MLQSVDELQAFVVVTDVLQSVDGLQTRVVVTGVEELEMGELWSRGVSLYTC